MGLLAEGTLVGGCRIEAIVGRGGMGVVYRARELALDRVVALKLIAPERTDDERTRARFLNEARAAAAVEHPNVVPVYGAGFDAGQAYLVMRYVPGENLGALVRAAGALELPEAAAVAVAVGAALDAIHTSGYVHRDVKPANVLIDSSGHVYLSDFGLAKQALASHGPTESGRWVGTLDFAAPEQIRGERVDAQSDVYALGGVLFFMVTGRVPFDGRDDAAKLWAHLTEAPPHVRELRQVPQRLDDIIDGALAKDRDARPDSAGALAQAASAAVGGAGRPPRPRHIALLRPTTAELSGTDTWTARPAGRTRRRSAVVGGALVLAAVAGAGAVVVASRDGVEPRSPRRAAATPQVSRGPATPPARGPSVGPTLHGVGPQPRGLAVAGGSVWLVGLSRARILRLDPRTMRRAGVQTRVARGGWRLAAGGGRVWVANVRTRKVLGIHARTGRVIVRITPPVTPVGLATDGDSVWVAGRVIPLDERARRPGIPDLLLRYGPDGRARGQTEIAEGIRALAAGGGRLWVALWDKPWIRSLTPAGRALRHVALEQPAGWMTWGAGYLWAAVPLQNAVARIDRGHEPTRVSRVGASPAGLAVAGRRVYVASNTEHAVHVVSARTGLPTETVLRVPPNPSVMAAGAGHVWVAGSGANTLTRIDP